VKTTEIKGKTGICKRVKNPHAGAKVEKQGGDGTAGRGAAGGETGLGAAVRAGWGVGGGAGVGAGEGASIYPGPALTLFGKKPDTGGFRAGDRVRNTGRGAWCEGVVACVVPAGHSAWHVCKRAGIRNVSLRGGSVPRPVEGYIVRSGGAHYFPRGVERA